MDIKPTISEINVMLIIGNFMLLKCKHETIENNILDGFLFFSLIYSYPSTYFPFLVPWSLSLTMFFQNQ